MASNYWIAQQKKENYKKQWLRLNPALTDESGIYILTREENGFRYAYIGQAKHILTRLAEHSLYHKQHIDNSISKHKLYSAENPTGWKVLFVYCPIDELDSKERFYINEYANSGYQLRNNTIGGQNEGKAGLGDGVSTKGYRDGLEQGYNNCLRDMKELMKYLKVDVSQFKKNGEPTEIAKRKLNEFIEKLK